MVEERTNVWDLRRCGDLEMVKECERIKVHCSEVIRRLEVKVEGVMRLVNKRSTGICCKRRNKVCACLMPSSNSTQRNIISPRLDK